MMIAKVVKLNYSLLLHQLLAFGAILCINPVMVSRVYSFHGKAISVFFFILMIFSLRNASVNSDDKHLGILGLMSIYCMFLSVAHADITIMDNAIQYLLILVFVLYIVKIIGIYNFSKTLIYVFSGLVIVNVILSIGLSLDIIAYSGAFKVGDHTVKTVLGFGNVTHSFSLSGININRMGGVFDEPGQFSYVIWHIVVLNRFILKSAKLEKILIYGGFITLSLAHFVVFLYFIVCVGHLRSVKKNAYKKILTLLLLSIFLVMLFTFVIQDSVFYDIFERTLLSRVNLVSPLEDGLFVGDRFTYSSQAFQLALKNPLLGFGLEKERIIAANFMDIFVAYGFLGGLIVFSPVLYIIAISMWKPVIHLIPCLAVCMLYIQRPSVGMFITTAILFLIIYQIRSANKSKNNVLGK